MLGFIRIIFMACMCLVLCSSSYASILDASRVSSFSSKVSALAQESSWQHSMPSLDVLDNAYTTLNINAHSAVLSMVQNTISKLSASLIPGLSADAVEALVPQKIIAKLTDNNQSSKTISLVASSDNADTKSLETTDSKNALTTSTKVVTSEPNNSEAKVDSSVKAQESNTESKSDNSVTAVSVAAHADTESVNTASNESADGSASQESAPADNLDVPSNLFVIISAILVIAMSVPGVALFYAGLVRAKNALSILEQCLVIFSVSIIIWLVVGYSLAFSSWGDEDRAGFLGFISLIVGNFDKALLLSVTPSSIFSGISEYTYIIFQGAFCAISGCLIVGALAERVRFSALIIGISIWTLFSYVPLAHMVWGGGLIEHFYAAYDFAGGTVVHINAAVAAIVAAKILGPRHQLHKIAMHPHSLPLTYLGCGLLWVGWFGFNAGSNIAPDGNSALAFANTVFAPVAGALVWTLLEVRIYGKPSTLGTASGVLAGLVGITPACAYVSPIGALIIGAAASAVCVWGVRGFKRMTKIDDSLDVFGIHGLGAIVGALLAGILCSPSLGGVGYKGFHDGMISQFFGQLWSVVVAIIWSGVVSVIAFKIAEKLCRSLRVSHDDETVGLDLTTHGERSYIL